MIIIASKLFEFVYIFPTLIAILIPICIISTYLMAVIRGDVEPILPMVSDAASLAPEASFFSSFVYVINVLLFLTLVIRYLQIYTILENEELRRLLSITLEMKDRITLMNRLAMSLAILIGSSLVAIASFRSIEMHLFHSLGAIPLFFGGPVLYLIETWITYQMIPYVNTPSMARYRLYLSLMALVSELLFSSLTAWSYFAFKKDWKRDRLNWKPNDGGYVQHVLGSAFEWIYLLLICPFIYTFVDDFKRFKLTESAKFHYIIEK